jgi:hypothetical protein
VESGEYDALGYDKDTLRVVRPAPEVLGELAFQIAFGNQTIYLFRTKDGLGRLSALRPYLTAGLPLSVQSLLIKELAWMGDEGKHD